MAEQSIKLNIAERIYPIKVAEGNEQQLLEAATLINNKLNDYREKFSVKDKQDLLSMAALDFVIDNLQKDTELASYSTQLETRLDQIDHAITSCLSKS